MNSFDFLYPVRAEIAIDGHINKPFSLSNGIARVSDVIVELKKNNGDVDVNITSSKSLISHLYLFYKIQCDSSFRVFGDAIERGYGEMGWEKPNNTHQMFWYFFLHDETIKRLQCFGVKVQPRSIVSFKIMGNLLKVDINVQSGGGGVNLDGRTLTAASFVYEDVFYHDLFTQCKSFIKKMMDGFETKKRPANVYGFNNWYYAYGNSSYEKIIEDTLLLEKLTIGLSNRPYMVIDDGWSVNPCSGPWEANGKFKDMKRLALEIKSHNVKPGIWFRPLKDLSGDLKAYRHPLNPELFDLSQPEVIERIKQDVRRFVDWGYELIKFDFVTVDVYLKYGFQMNESLCDQGWRFKDNHFTNAEMLLNLYKAIREAAPKAVLIGCNAIPHLSAGIVELNRVGDDTSGIEWNRTLKYGVNSLAFRMMQNGIFYAIDGDCVGITGKIDWKQNKEWLRLLSWSGTPLFVSIDPLCCTEEIENDLKHAFQINGERNLTCIPTDWLENNLPTQWEIKGETKTFHWNVDENINW